MAQVNEENVLSYERGEDDVTKRGLDVLPCIRKLQWHCVGTVLVPVPRVVGKAKEYV